LYPKAYSRGIGSCLTSGLRIFQEISRSFTEKVSLIAYQDEFFCVNLVADVDAGDDQPISRSSVSSQNIGKDVQLRMTKLIYIHHNVPENWLSTLLQHVGWVPSLLGTDLTQLSSKIKRI
jgi:hypothetical protein